MATATIEGTVPAVYTGIAAILAELGVKKNGQLPTNMGGKSYIAAVDVSAEIKILLVKHGLVVLPNERLIKHEAIQANNRITIATAIEGEYTFVSTVDGSVAKVTGVGDGLANGNAVSSNIASTNAMKNAMLRTFMITEQSAEDQAKNGVDESPAAQPKAIAAAQGGSTQAAKPASSTAVADLQAEIKAAVAEVAEATGATPNYAAIGKRLFGDKDPNWATKVDSLKAVLKAVQSGEVA